jgi:hypothetical protein
MQKAIVQSPQLREGGRRHPQQEPSERGGLGITRQAGQVLEDAILAEQLRGLDSFEAEDHRVEQSQEHLPDAVAVVALNEPRRLGQQLLEPQPTEEAMHQIRPAIVGQ